MLYIAILEMPIVLKIKQIKINLQINVALRDDYSRETRDSGTNHRAEIKQQHIDLKTQVQYFTY